ncbi:YHYH protein [Rubripirellula sp.]|jgi:hypothetical protein|nr:YHYH protein [Rubripirellula sp.]
MYRRFTLITLPILLIGLVAAILAQRPPPIRLHRITKKAPLNLIPAQNPPVLDNQVSMKIEDTKRVIRSNGIPNHRTGAFPNSGNPNRISEQAHQYSIPINPEIAEQTTAIQGEFGVAVNGVPFDPGAGEFYDGEPGWQYEPLSGAIALGIDVSHAHVQPNGKYHYHGLPTGLLDSVNLSSKQHSSLIGWAADGFPIYAVYGYENPADPKSKIIALKSSYQLKAGKRPGGNAPTGEYDGTFVRDYEFVAGSGDLDECNGRKTITPEFPNGSYAYFLTEQWPVIPRLWRGTPSEDFMRRGVVQRGSRVTEANGESFRPDNPQEPQPMNRANGRPSPLGRPVQPDGFGPPRPGQIFPNFLLESLRLTDEQFDAIEKLQSDVDKRIKEILTQQQMNQLNNLSPNGNRPRPQRPPGFDRY